MKNFAFVLGCSLALLALANCIDHKTDDGQSHLQNQSCGAVDQPCCVQGPNSATCDTGLVCTATKNGDVCTAPPPPSCGGNGQACCNGQACDAGLTCEPPVCQSGKCGPATCAAPPPPPPSTCGDVKQVCCNGWLCNQGLTCSNGACL